MHYAIRIDDELHTLRSHQDAQDLSDNLKILAEAYVELGDTDSAELYAALGNHVLFEWQAIQSGRMPVFPAQIQ